MTFSPSGEGSESHQPTVLKALRSITLAIGLLVLVLAAMLELTWQQQAFLGLGLVALSLWLHRRSPSTLVTLTLVLLSSAATLRYAWWRTSTVFRALDQPGGGSTLVGACFVILLLGAEWYAFLTLLLGYAQTLWPLQRTPVPLPEDTTLWPEVDVLITTCNEPLSVVKYTALAAAQIDWPVDRLNVFVLDDGRRHDFQEFCAEAGIGYLSREDAPTGKPGNLNHALGQVHAPFVAIFDADDVPTRSFLQLTIGWFVREQRLAILQTPRRFYSPDPFERNLQQFRTVPNQDELFYGVVQDGNDFWNAATFCGSCAIIRRAALDEVGGFAVEKGIEDAQTSLRMQKIGWNTGYLNIPQAAGLATERLSGYLRQRIRWAQGTVYALRLENPLFARGLNLAQRLCYFHQMSQFLYAIPRLVFLVAPLMFLFLGRMPIPGTWTAIAAFAVPYLLLKGVVQARVQGRHRHLFWNHIYETVLAPHLVVPTLSALLLPNRSRLRGPEERDLGGQTDFDTRIATPFVVLLCLNLLGILCALPRLLPFPSLSTPWGGVGAVSASLEGLYDAGRVGIVWVYVLWASFNSVVLGVAVAVAHERQQRRVAPRVPVTTQATVLLPDGKRVRGATSDLSRSGAMIRAAEPVSAQPGDMVYLIFPLAETEVRLPATVVAAEGTILRAHFADLTLPQAESLATVLYARADAWLELGQTPVKHRPLAGLWRIVQLALRGLGLAVQSVFGIRRKSSRGWFASAIPGIVVSVLAGIAGLTNHAYCQVPRASTQASLATAADRSPTADRSAFQTSFTLRAAHVSAPILLRGGAASRSVHFEVPQSVLVHSATLRLRYAFAPGLASSGSHLAVSLNQALLTTLPVPENTVTPTTVTVPLPPELLVNSNELRFEFYGSAGTGCTAGTVSALWVRVDPDSIVDLSGDRLPLQPDLKLLPSPFLEDAQNAHPVIPIVFPTPPSFKELEAAGVVTSWLGLAAGERTPRFPVVFGRIPSGNAIVISDRPEQFPPGLRIEDVSGPMLAMRENPGDSSSRVLVVTGANGDDLLIAARVLALRTAELAGATDRVSLEGPLPIRRPDDAPRWLPTDTITRFGELTAHDLLSTDGSAPIRVPLRLPPDLDLGDRENLPLRLLYRYDGIPLAADSSLDLSVNGIFAGSTPLPHREGASPALGTSIPVPVSSLQPGLNTVEGTFHLRPLDPCPSSPPSDLHGSILGDSFLDLRGIPHWTALPNLALFARAGYPFTRLGDLSQTAIVLSENASPEIVELYLALLARFGQETGVPATAVSVIDADGMDGTRDYLILGSLENLPARGKLAASLPLQFLEDGVRLQEPPDLLGWFGRHVWPGASSSGQVVIHGGVPDAVLEAIGWRGRSVVLITLRNKNEVSPFLSALADPAEIGQSASVLRGSRFQSYRFSNGRYYVGTLSRWEQLARFFGAHPWLLVLVLASVCFGLASVLEPMLRQHARRRLQTPV